MNQIVWQQEMVARLKARTRAAMRGEVILSQEDPIARWARGDRSVGNYTEATARSGEWRREREAETKADAARSGMEALRARRSAA